ncbi:MAG: class II aldolase/adducin family protein [Ruminococcaceae bacterium]|nr:class II aldolase/adducin family protein [Oscillospiraceae bacterium]
MDILEAKELVIRAGKELLKAGIIVRTWGNISCRISDTQFVITPSGLAYEDLTPEQIVLVNIADLSYDGDIKPSSEKGIHAAAYKLRPDANFVIHTHQVQASVIGSLGFDINYVAPKSAEIVGNDVPLAAYGLPGTGKLREGVIAAIKRTDSKAVLMAHHGALCMGADYDEAFKVASELEVICEDCLKRRYNKVTGEIAESVSAIADYIGEKFASAKAAACPKVDACNSHRDGSVFNIAAVDGDGTVTRIDIKTGKVVAGDDYPNSAELHRAIYRKYADVNYIIHNTSPEVKAVSMKGKKMKPLLDDFAQLVGVTVRHTVFDPNSTLKTAKKAAKALKGRNAVLLDNNGAICVADSEYNATAVDMVMEKGCKTQIGADLFGSGSPINPIETHLMRFIYLKKYSKKASK